ALRLNARQMAPRPPSPLQQRQSSSRSHDFFREMCRSSWSPVPTRSFWGPSCTR
ncbi:hypothetical protein M9458_009082, partial [Cirrhinus mrigala]